METYSHRIYESWKKIQEQKYKEILHIVGRQLFQKMFSSMTLDIGCGDSIFLQFLRRNGIAANIIGLDIVNDPQNGIRTVLGDGDAPPFLDKSFDTVVCIDTAHLLNTNNFNHVLKDGGFALFALFFNDENYEDQKNVVKEKLTDFDILLEFELQLHEKEYVVLARKKQTLPIGSIRGMQ